MKEEGAREKQEEKNVQAFVSGEGPRSVEADADLSGGGASGSARVLGHQPGRAADAERDGKGRGIGKEFRAKFSSELPSFDSTNRKKGEKKRGRRRHLAQNRTQIPARRERDRSASFPAAKGAQSHLPGPLCRVESRPEAAGGPGQPPGGFVYTANAGWRVKISPCVVDFFVVVVFERV